MEKIVVLDKEEALGRLEVDDVNLTDTVYFEIEGNVVPVYYELVHELQLFFHPSRIELVKKHYPAIEAAILERI